jgi:hypothetical protein
VIATGPNRVSQVDFKSNSALEDLKGRKNKICSIEPLNMTVNKTRMALSCSQSFFSFTAHELNTCVHTHYEE